METEGGDDAKFSQSSTRASSRKNRVFVLRKFLWDAYGGLLSSARTDGVILDAAGGKGDLSWLLTNVDDLASVVVDPRLPKNHLVKSVEYLRAHPEEAHQRALPGLPTYQPLAELIPKLEEKDTFAKPRHLRILVNQELVDAVRSAQRGSGTWDAFWAKATQEGKETHTLGYKEDFTLSENQIVDPAEAFETILNTRLIVGFHPDQATDACIDLAVLLQVPYCVVPCCVFPSDFPHRRGSDGNRVRVYQELIEYLKDKDPRVRMCMLPFHETSTARNIALYTLPCDCSPVKGSELI
jgi:hypothetical protein